MLVMDLDMLPTFRRYLDAYPQESWDISAIKRQDRRTLAVATGWRAV